MKQQAREASQGQRSPGATSATWCIGVKRWHFIHIKCVVGAWSLRSQLITATVRVHGAEDRTDREKVLEHLEKSMNDPQYEPAHEPLSRLRLTLLVGMQHEDAPQALRDYADKHAQEEDLAGEMNDLAWAIYERHRDAKDVKPEILKAALHMARVAVKLQPKSGAINDTVAHLVYVADENLDEAIEWQKKAVANAEGREDDLQPFLDQLLEEKKTGKKKKDSAVCVDNDNTLVPGVDGMLVPIMP